MRIAKLPLDPKAVEAADRALYQNHSELKGRKLTMAPADGTLRREWMDAYIAAGGNVEPPKPKCSPAAVASPCPTDALTEKEAQGLFEQLKQNKVIPFDYPNDCCYSRAHAMCRIMESKGIACSKYWLFSKDFPGRYAADLKPADKAGNPVNKTGTTDPINWTYHVAPVVKVKKSDGTTEERVMDPSLFDKPVTKEEWSKRQGDPPGSYGEDSDSVAYFQNKKIGAVPGGAKEHWYAEDPTGQTARDQMDDHRQKRDKALTAEKAKKGGAGP